MSVLVTTLEPGRRLQMNRDAAVVLDYGVGKLDTLMRAGFVQKGGDCSTVSWMEGRQDIPAKAKLVVFKADAIANKLEGCLVWRDGMGNLRAGHARNLPPDWFDSIRGASRLPGESKPGEQPQGQQGEGDGQGEGEGEQQDQPQQEQQGKQQESQQGDDTCPECKTGKLVQKSGRFGDFIGCSNFPKCRYTRKQQQQDEPQPQQPQQEQPQPQPEPPKPMGLEEIIKHMIQQVVGDTLNADLPNRLQELEAKLGEMGNGGGKQSWHIQINEQEPRKLDGVAHKSLPEFVKRCMLRNHKGLRFAQMLVGEAGTGKSTLCEQAAQALGLRFAYVNCSGGMSESRLIGRMTPNLATGEEHYTTTAFVDFYENGGLFLLDELDAADANVIITLNGLMEASHWTAPDGRTIKRGENHILAAACNTYGTGADRKYTGRNQLDAAFLNRWLTLTVDYDTDLEKELTITEGLAEKFQGARLRIRELNMRRWLTPRDILRADALVQQAQYTVPDAIIAATDGWTQEERGKVGLI